mgnify:CR=1 FL=1
MEIKSRFDHFNINVLDLDRSIAFYGKALGLKEHHRKEATDGSFTLVYLTDNVREYHRELGYICFENNEMGLYFINDPDDYWIEILPAK